MLHRTIIFKTALISVLIGGFFILFIGFGGANHIRSILRLMLPTEIRHMVKEVILGDQLLLGEQQIAEINKLKRIINDMQIFHYLEKTPDVSYKSSHLVPEIIKSKSGDYILKKYPLPFPDFHTGGTKAVAYFDQTDMDVIMVTGNGIFMRYKKKDIGSERIEFEIVRSNLIGVINDNEMFRTNNLGIKDIRIINDHIYLAYTKEQSTNCYNTSILRAKTDLEYLEFIEFFSYDECRSQSEATTQNNYLHDWWYTGHQTGGRIFPYDDNKLLFTIGDWEDKVKAQDPQSMWGKIIAIDLDDREHEVISMGHRNPQGLYYDELNRVIVSTDHGPTGGDEVNVNINPQKSTKNFGWPISSYGTIGLESDGSTSIYPKHKSHEDFGFIEPSISFTPGIGISEIIKVPKSINELFTNDFFIASMGFKAQVVEHGDMTIHHIRFDEKFNHISFQERIPIHERIRDMMVVEETNAILLLLETTPAIGVLSPISLKSELN
jgi:hypothetical protein